MNITSEKRYASFILKLLLGNNELDYISDMLKGMDWILFQKIAKKNVVLIRCYDKITSLGIEIRNREFVDAVAVERYRVQKTIELICVVAKICAGMGISYMYAKAFQHYPDMGGDIDLLIMDKTNKLDRIIVDKLGAVELPNTFFNRIAGKNDYKIEQYPTHLEIHHGRMGYVGEYARYPIAILERCKKLDCNGLDIIVPSNEDVFLIQVLQRMYSHFRIRISDVVRSVDLLSNHDLDWKYILKVAKSMGVYNGLCHYLAYVNHIHNDVFDQNIMPEEISNIFQCVNGDSVVFSNCYFRYPLVRVCGVIFLKKITSDICSGDLGSVGRLLLFPSIAALTVAKFSVNNGIEPFRQAFLIK